MTYQIVIDRWHCVGNRPSSRTLDALNSAGGRNLGLGEFFVRCAQLLHVSECINLCAYPAQWTAQIDRLDSPNI